MDDERHGDPDAFEDTIAHPASVAPTMALGDTTPETPSAKAALPSYQRGDSLGRYVVLDKLGEGAMGAVYTAYDPELDRRVALKVLHPQAASSEAKTQGQGWLAREAKAMARLSHPNVIQVFDVGTLEGSGDVYIAMEHVDGETLRDWLIAEERTPGEVLDVFRQAARGLAHAHSQGVVHRDFKPDNCLIDRAGRVRVIDFGIARTEAADEHLPPAPSGETAKIASLVQTQAGMIIGTPAYMSLEQLEGRAADERSDQFALCVSLYQGLYRQPPFAGESLLARMSEVIEGRVRPAPEHSPAPAWVEPVLRKGLSTQANDRYPSMDALLAALEPPASRDRGRGTTYAVVGLGALAAVAAGVAFAWPDPAPPPPPLCQGLDARLDGVWDDARRAAVTQALGASERAHAGATVERVVAALDRRAEAWLAMRVEACEDTRVRQDVSEAAMDLRMGCLDRRLAELDTAARVLEDTGAETVDQAVQLVVELPPLERCADLARLEAEAAHEPPPALAERVRELGHDATRVRTLARAGAYDEAETASAALVEAAREVGYDPLTSEALIARSSSLVHAGDFPEARDVLMEAAWRASSSDDPRLEAEAWIGLVFVVGSKLREREEGLRYEGFARAALGRAGDAPILEARLAYYLGLIRAAIGQDEDALASLRQAESIYRTALEEDDWRFASVIGAQASALNHLGRSAEAIAEYQRAIDLLQASLGPDHPSNAALMNNLAIALRRAHRLDEARAAFERALALKRLAYGADHPSVALTLVNLGGLHARLGDFERARGLFREARDLRARTLGESHPLYTNTLVAEGELELMRGAPDAALPLFETALAQYEGQGDGYPIAQARSGLGHALYRAGRARAAEPLLRQALAYYEAEGVEERPSAIPRARLGAVLVELGRPGEAVEPLERALAATTAADADPEDRGFVRYALGRALLESGRAPTRGHDLVDAARRDFEEAGPAGAWATARVTAWLEAHPRPDEPG